jgi:protein-arginine kinase activator protein McsA
MVDIIIFVCKRCGKELTPYSDDEFIHFYNLQHYHAGRVDNIIDRKRTFALCKDCLQLLNEFLKGNKNGTINMSK